MSSYKDYRLSSDTTLEAEEVIFDLLRKKSPAEKLRMVCQASAMVRTLAMSGLRERYPQETNQQLQIRLAEQLYGAELAGQIALKLTSAQAK